MVTTTLSNRGGAVCHPFSVIPSKPCPTNDLCIAFGWPAFSNLFDSPLGRKASGYGGVLMG